jgi:hypothetical protein
MLKEYMDQYVGDARNETNDLYLQLLLERNMTLNPTNKTMSVSHQNISQNKTADAELFQFLLATNYSYIANDTSGDIQTCDLYGHRLAGFRSNPWYITFYQFLSDLILVEILPWIIVIVFNIFVWKASRKFHERRLKILSTRGNTRGKI